MSADTKPRVSRQTRYDALPDLLRVEEVAAYAGVSKFAVYGAINSGQIPSVKFGRVVRVHKTALAALTGEQSS